MGNVLIGIKDKIYKLLSEKKWFVFFVGIAMVIFVFIGVKTATNFTKDLSLNDIPLPIFRLMINRKKNGFSVFFISLFIFLILFSVAFLLTLFKFGKICFLIFSIVVSYYYGITFCILFCVLNIIKAILFSLFLLLNLIIFFLLTLIFVALCNNGSVYCNIKNEKMLLEKLKEFLGLFLIFITIFVFELILIKTFCKIFVFV